MFFLFYGNRQIKINGEYQKGAKTKSEAIALGNSLKIEIFRGVPLGTN
mgnify:CR=1 FL=1